MKPQSINPYQTQEAYQTLFEQAPDAVVAIDERNRIIFWNPKAEAIFGWKAAEVITQSLTDFIIPAAYREAHNMGMQRFLATGEVRVLNRTIEVPAINKKGEEFFIALTIAKTQLDDRVAFLAFIRDVTEQKRNQTILEQKTIEVERTATKLRTVLDTSQAGVFMALPVRDDLGNIVDFTFTMANSALALFAGQTPEALIGEKGSRWFARYTTNGLFDRFCETFQSGEKQQFEFHYIGQTIEAWVNVMTSKIGEELFCSFTDLTPLKLTQFQLEQTIQELRRSNANLEEFAHAASHDMKEPIRKILTFTDRLKMSLETRLTETEKELLSKVENATQRMGLLVDDLLEFSHVSERPAEKKEVNLNVKVKKVLTDLELLLEEKRAQVKVGALPTIKGYERQLQQLLQNIIGNALKYSKPQQEPLIEITSQTIYGNEISEKVLAEQLGQQFHLIAVRDNGIGFEPEYAEQIFGMFQRLHGRAEYAGTGVGLSIARKVVENHNGYIWAESTLGEGATFYVLIPVEK